MENWNTLKMIKINTVKNNPFLRIMETVTHKIVILEEKR